MERSSSLGTDSRPGPEGSPDADLYGDPAAFGGAAARMLAAEGRDGVPAVLALLGQELRADVRLLEARACRTSIPKPRLQAVAGSCDAVAEGSAAAPINFPIRSRNAVLAVLSITLRQGISGLPPAWTALPEPLATRLRSKVSPRIREGRALRQVLSELCAKSQIPVQLRTPGSPDLEVDPQLSPVVAAAGFRFVQAALLDLIARGADAAEVRLAYGASGVSIDVHGVGDKPAWPDQPGQAMQRWVTRVEMLGGSSLLRLASAHLRFGPADADIEAPSPDRRVERTM